MLKDYNNRIRKLLVSCLLVLTGVLGWSADYLREGPDVGGTGWVKDEKIFTLDNVKDTKLLWKMKLDTAARVNYNLLAPLIVGSVKTAGGDKQIVVVGGVSDDLFAIDAGHGHAVVDQAFRHHRRAGRGGGLSRAGRMRCRSSDPPRRRASTRCMRSPGMDGSGR